MDCGTPGLPVHYQLLELAQTHVRWAGDAIQPSYPLFSPSPPTFNLSLHQEMMPSNESALCIRWMKYWSFSFSISPSSEHSGLISFRMDWLDILAVQGTFNSLLQARLQQYVNHESPDVQAGFRKGRGNRDQIANIHWIIEKAREFQKTSISALLTMAKPLTVWITINCGKLWKRWEYQTTWPASWETYMQVRKQQLELDMEQQTGSK